MRAAVIVPQYRAIIKLLYDNMDEEDKKMLLPKSKGLLRDDVLSKKKSPPKISSIYAPPKSEKIIQVCELPGFELKNVLGDGNCFFRALWDQMKFRELSTRPKVPRETEGHNVLRLHHYGAGSFRDGEWAGSEEEYYKLCKTYKFVIALLGMRDLRKTTIYYFIDPRTNEGTFTQRDSELPEGLPIMRLVYTGSHYFSVRRTPEDGNVAATSHEGGAGAAVKSREKKRKVPEDENVAAAFDENAGEGDQRRSKRFRSSGLFSSSIEEVDATSRAVSETGLEAGMDTSESVQRGALEATHISAVRKTRR
ncbi:MAG: hypothetical protein A2298_03045 [Gammaproteobacteria bacterium RIFOXYB2_FULL_38_6]|nr:MAG: hypothetical protein A2298_03045 [Gammaproteobacteria bacterium RIFOXYB2_FULL_38_6]